MKAGGMSAQQSFGRSFSSKIMSNQTSSKQSVLNRHHERNMLTAFMTGEIAVANKQVLQHVVTNKKCNKDIFVVS